MSWEIDHVFFATSDAESAERALTEYGLVFTERRVHQGQGTANSCAIFENAFFEILRPFDAQELASARVEPLGLKERIHWPDTGACPFGLCFRPSHPDGEPEPWPFETWRYEAAYLPKGASIPIVTPIGRLWDPLVFVSTRARSAGGDAQGSPLHHSARRTLTGVNIYRPGLLSNVSTSVRWFSENRHFTLTDGPAHALELEWDHGLEGMRHQFPTGLPIVLRW